MFKFRSDPTTGLHYQATQGFTLAGQSPALQAEDMTYYRCPICGSAMLTVGVFIHPDVKVMCHGGETSAPLIWNNDGQVMRDPEPWVPPPPPCNQEMVLFADQASAAAAYTLGGFLAVQALAKVMVDGHGDTT